MLLLLTMSTFLNSIFPDLRLRCFDQLLLLTFFKGHLLVTGACLRYNWLVNSKYLVHTELTFPDSFFIFSHE